MSEKSPFSFDFGFSGKSESQGNNMEPDKSGVATAANSDPASEARSHIESIRQTGKRGRRSNAEIEAERAKLREEMQQQVAALFEPEVWGDICRGPADLMLHVSKRELWNVPDREIKPLAVSASHTARLFLQTDAKWIALFMCAVSITQIYGSRIALHIAQTRKEERERKAHGNDTSKPV